LSASAFELRIDGQTGEIRVTPPPISPAQVVSSNGLAGSLLGRDAVEMSATPCVFTPIPNNAKQRRCTFSIQLTNKLTVTDLVTPTTFPRPPQGTTGLLVFPYTAAALGVPGGGAVPNDAWNYAPTNFFNDFASCSTGKTTDCYRYELFPGPLYGGESTGWQEVGFDVDKAAYDVAVYLVVAADLRENLPQQLRIPTSDCKRLARSGDNFNEIGTNTWTISANIYDFGIERVTCSFPLGDLAGRRVRQATVRFVQEFTEGTPYDNGLAPVVMDWMTWTGTPSAQDLWLGTGAVSTLAVNIGTLSDKDEDDTERTLDVTTRVLSDLGAGRVATRYRIRFLHDDGGGSGSTGFYKNGPESPVLLVEYVNP
ncbi:MAG TPA: hypothetical protein VFX50_04340, partial [Gemmatimonadales bacterium]|nr:hypothetical protein [Gemmatimonadales bacterium]